MEYENKVNVVDAMIGAGKTSAAINYINSSYKNERFLVITQSSAEIQRYCTECPSKEFKVLTFENGRKNGLWKNQENLKEQFTLGNNIITSHTFLREFNDENIRLCKRKNYTLIMDETPNIIKKLSLSKSDLKILKDDFITTDEDTDIMHWNANQDDYKGKFSEIKRLCELEALTLYGKVPAMWLFPAKTLDYFNRAFILTYMFSVQPLSYYYNYCGLKYSFMSVECIDGKYSFANNCDQSNAFIKYGELIHIIDSPKMNDLGNKSTDLSLPWFEKHKGDATMAELKRNVLNFFRHMRNDKSNDDLWSTFKRYESQVKGAGYAKAFVPLSCRATNDYQTRTSVAFLANCHMEAFTKKFFESYGFKIDDDKFALSEMMQVVWRSAIRRDTEIWVYIPSSRMRNLLINWIKEHDGGINR